MSQPALPLVRDGDKEVFTNGKDGVGVDRIEGPVSETTAEGRVEDTYTITFIGGDVDEIMEKIVET